MSKGLLFRSTGLFLLPFMFIALINIISGIKYYSFPNDGTASYFGMGLSWVMGLYPKLYFHQPAFFFHEIAAILVLLSGIPDNDLHQFNNIGMITNFLFVLIGAFWTALITKSTGLRGIYVLLAAMIAASIPISILCMSMWTFNFPIVTLSVPLGLSLAAISQQSLKDVKLIRTAYFVFGFMVANYYLALVLLLAWFGSRLYGDYLEYRRELIDTYKRRFYEMAAGVVQLLAPALFISSVWTGINFIIPKYQYIRISGMVVLGLIVGVYIYLLWRKKDQFFGHSFNWGVLGWIFGANLMALPWIGSFYLSFASTGGTQYKGEKFGYLANLEYVWNFVKENPWHGFIPLLFIGLIARLLVYMKQKKIRLSGYFVFVGIALLLNIPLVGDLTFTTSGDPKPEAFGLISRYYLPMLVPLTGLVLFTGDFPRYLRTITICIAFIFSAASIHKFSVIAPQVVEATDEIVQELNGLIGEHLQKNEANIVYFVETVRPEKASVLYALNKFRRKHSVEIWRKSELDGGRLRYVHEYEMSRVDELESLDRALIVHRGRLPEEFQAVYKKQVVVVSRYTGDLVQ